MNTTAKLVNPQLKPLATAPLFEVVAAAPLPVGEGVLPLPPAAVVEEGEADDEALPAGPTVPPLTPVVPTVVLPFAALLYAAIPLLVSDLEIQKLVKFWVHINKHWKKGTGTYGGLIIPTIPAAQ